MVRTHGDDDTVMTAWKWQHVDDDMVMTTW